MCLRTRRNDRVGEGLHNEFHDAHDALEDRVAVAITSAVSIGWLRGCGGTEEQGQNEGGSELLQGNNPPVVGEEADEILELGADRPLLTVGVTDELTSLPAHLHFSRAHVQCAASGWGRARRMLTSVMAAPFDAFVGKHGPSSGRRERRRRCSPLDSALAAEGENTAYARNDAFHFPAR